MPFLIPAAPTLAAAAAGTATAGSAAASTALATALTVGATAYTGYSAYQQGNYQAQVASMNAKLAEENASRARYTAQTEQFEQDQNTAAYMGALEAEQGSSGLSVGSGSSIRTRRSAARLGRIDALKIRQAGDLDAYNSNVQAANFKAQSGASKADAKSGLVGSFLSAGGSLIGAAQPYNRKARVGVPVARRKSLGGQV